MEAGSFVIGLHSGKNSVLGASLESQHPVVNQHGSRREGECSDGSFSRKMNSVRVYGAHGGQFTGPQERNEGLG